MRWAFLLLCVVSYTSLIGQKSSEDSTRIIKVYDRTLRVPSSFQHVHDDSAWCDSGYITDGIDTLYYNKCMAIMPMCIEMELYRCGPYEDSAECAELNSKAKSYNDSLRKEDPRIGKYHNSLERGCRCYYDTYSPMQGVTGYFALEINGYHWGRPSFLLSTTNIDPERQTQWRNILQTLSK